MKKDCGTFVNLGQQNTALLVFSLSADNEITRESIFNKHQKKENAAFFDILIQQTKDLAYQSGIDVFWVDEHQQIGIDFSSRFVNAFQRLFDKGYENVNGMWTSIGWNSKNPEINYGTGGLLHGKQYILTSSWNAPQGAFTLPNEFFKEIGIDNDSLSGFYGMNRYLGMKLHTLIQFHDVEKNSDISKELSNYEQFLKTVL